jgi:hypothetical protein
VDILSPLPVLPAGAGAGAGGAAEPALLRFFAGFGCDDGECRRLAGLVLGEPGVPRHDPAAAVAHADALVRGWFAAVLGGIAGPSGASGARAAFLMLGGARRWPGALLSLPAADGLVEALAAALPQGVPPALPGAMLDQPLDPVWSPGRARARRPARRPGPNG